MNQKYRQLLLPILVCLFICSIALVYMDDVMSLPNETSERIFYPPPIGHYPAQFLPFLAVIPGPTQTPAPVPTLHPGLQLRWDGKGHIYFDNYYWNPGTHEHRVVDRQIDADTVRILARSWYSPNPFNWPEENWYCHYNSHTNHVETCSSQGDPAWKWGYPWILPKELELVNARPVTIDGQSFSVTGPHTYLTGYGETEQFWRLVNRNRFLFHHNGDEWKQYVEVGDAVLFYEYSKSRVLLFSNIKRTYYRNDNWTGDNVRYEEVLTILDGFSNISSELKTTESQSDNEISHQFITNPQEMVEHLGRLGVSSESLANTNQH